MGKILTYFLLLLLLVLTAKVSYGAEPDPLSRISTQIEQHPVVQAEFTQTKQIAALKRPLITAGRLVFSRQHGVLWRIEQPYRMSYVLGEERIIEIGSDGVRKVRGLRDVPGLAQVGRVFTALLGANAAKLREYFEADVKGDPEKWEIDLKPKQVQLAQFLVGLHLSGGRYVESIRIDEANGDITKIQFRHSQGAETLSQADKSYFD